MNTIEAQNISIGYGDKVIVDQLSITIPHGQITTLIGPNGSGKSTLIRAIAHLLPPTTGVILLDHQNIQQIKSKTFAKKIAVLPQTNQTANDLTVEELVSFGRLPYRRPLSGLTTTDHQKIEWALTQASLQDLRQRPLSTLSGGQRKRAWIAMAVAQDTDTIILDEPTTYLDLTHQLEVMQLVKKLNEQAHRTIIMALHDLNHAARISDQLIALKDGHVLAHGPVSTVMTAANLKTIFNIDATLVDYHGTPLILTYNGCQEVAPA
ncbi:ABC transporter ATP-binding protein [Lactiplantibacillus plantarum]|uniref:ABC transporter ATP-binding protein n=1 Tax=Lactiplantibacillus plantarum TaxID=1590 RepID=UPI000B41082B|nr:ABC transporter ATP-binding protein [Lactiplantibacillus plantarum]